MNLLSHPALAELTALQAAARELANNRITALQVLRASRNDAAPSAQPHCWKEFARLDREYRLAVAKLAAFCARHTSLATCEERRQA
jgi:hypothetical protein